MSTGRMVQHCGWKTDGGGLLHRLRFPGGKRSMCGIFISEMAIPWSEFWNMGKCKKCFPSQPPTP